MQTEGAGRDRRIAFRLDSGDAIVAGTANPIRIVERPTAPRLASKSATGLRPSFRGRSIMSWPRLRSKKETTPPGVWSRGAFFPLGGDEAMSLAHRLREALLKQRRPCLRWRAISGRRCAEANVPAAVLIGVTRREEPGVILTVRREHMRTHAGQVAFPGGRIDPGENAVAAALREAWEELGLQPDTAEVVGEVDPYRTVTGYVVTPVLAVIAAGPAAQPARA